MAENKTPSTRIYRVTQVIEGIKKVRLVRAEKAAQAANFVASDTITVEMPTQDELIELAVLKVPVETAKPANLPLI